MSNISFSKTTWLDTSTSGTAITSAQLNRIETAINNLVSAVNKINSLQILYSDTYWRIYTVSNMVCVYVIDVVTGSNKSDGSWDKAMCSYNIPAAYRPKQDIQVPCVTGNGSSWTGCLQALTDGTIEVFNYGNHGSNDKRCGFLVYPIQTDMA